MKKLLLFAFLAVATCCAAVDTPTQNYPSNNAQNLPAQVQFLVSATTAANTLQMEIDTCQAFNSPMKQSFQSFVWSPYNQCFYQIAGNLMFGRTHYWRVRACTDSDTSAWSPVRSFSTISNPTLKSPADSLTNTDVTVQLAANKVDGCTNYIWEADTTPLFNSHLKKSQLSMQYKGQLNAYIHNMGNLNFNRRYYWRVAMCNAVDTSGWSEVRWFETTDIPLLVDPTDDTTGLDNEVEVAVLKIAGTTGYIYQLSTTPSFANPVMLSSFHYDVKRTAYIDTFKLLKYNTKYYWRACAYHDDDTSAWSAARSFRVTKSAKLNSPANGSEGDIKFQVTLTVKPIAGTTMYVWQMDTTPNFNSSAFQRDTSFLWNATQKLYTQFFAGLEYGTKYYWRVKAFSPNDTSAWSDVWTFTTICELPNAPKLISPADNDTIYSADPVLLWHPIANAKKYSIDVAEDSAFALVVRMATTADTTVTIDGLTLNKRYFWRIYGYNDAKRSPDSETRSFWLSDGTSAVRDIRQEQVIIWPNPTNGIVYLGEEQAITVTDLSGRTITKSFGSSVDISNMPAGIYLVNGIKVVKN